MVRKGKKALEEKLAKGKKPDNKAFFKHIRVRKPARKSGRPVNDQGMRGALKKDKTVVQTIKIFYIYIHYRRI